MHVSNELSFFFFYQMSNMVWVFLFGKVRHILCILYYSPFYVLCRKVDTNVITWSYTSTVQSFVQFLNFNLNCASWDIHVPSFVQMFPFCKVLLLNQSITTYVKQLICSQLLYVALSTDIFWQIIFLLLSTTVLYWQGKLSMLEEWSWQDNRGVSVGYKLAGFNTAQNLTINTLLYEVNCPIENLHEQGSK